jgi:hypothetical protein
MVNTDTAGIPAELNSLWSYDSEFARAVVDVFLRGTPKNLTGVSPVLMLRHLRAAAEANEDYVPDYVDCVLKLARHYLSENQPSAARDELQNGIDGIIAAPNHYLSLLIELQRARRNGGEFTEGAALESTKVIEEMLKYTGIDDQLKYRARRCLWCYYFNVLYPEGGRREKIAEQLGELVELAKSGTLHNYQRLEIEHLLTVSHYRHGEFILAGMSQEKLLRLCEDQSIIQRNSKLHTNDERNPYEIASCVYVLNDDGGLSAFPSVNTLNQYLFVLYLETESSIFAGISHRLRFS